MSDDSNSITASNQEKTDSQNSDLENLENIDKLNVEEGAEPGKKELEDDDESSGEETVDDGEDSDESDEDITQIDVLNKDYTPYPLSVEMMSDLLSIISYTADHMGQAFIKLQAIELNLTHVTLLADFIHLRFVDLSYNRIKDLSPLNNLEFLLQLRVDFNLLTAVQFPVYNFLQRLSFCGNYINNSQGFFHPNLKDLDLSNNRLSSMEESNLSSLPFLQTMNVSYNRLRNIGGIAALSLTKLYMSENKIKNLNGFEVLENLELLHLRDNKIKNISPLQHLTSLFYINLRNNRIKRAGQFINLENNKKLRSLICLGNPVQEKKKYMSEVLMAVPWLLRLDKHFITKKDIKEMEEVREAKKELEKLKEQEKLLLKMEEEMKKREDEDEEEDLIFDDIGMIPGGGQNGKHDVDFNSKDSPGKISTG